MVEVLHLAAVFPAAVGLCCAVGDRRSRARSVVPAAAMLIAMIAMATGWPAVSPLVWAGALVVLGIGAAAQLRVRAGGGGGHGRQMQLHRALGLVLGAALLVVSTATHEGVAGSGHPAHPTLGSPLAVTLAGAAGYLVFTAWLVARSTRRRSPLVGAVEASAMGLMTALMAIAPLAG
ncbi:hypothetical protein J7E25_16435 [Agromyces sp. ISL-38]|uniref:hypothetical protein n=1 Tax=Agromyces sp. ISL-38 TaxID=2819107 RepID=UPI001BEB704A|nr:hypothetical protein [Agromyces sp. ISL-38]MBT2500685.1 hypothetical protein [Agromyces sp. ISL-38]